MASTPHNQIVNQNIFIQFIIELFCFVCIKCCTKSQVGCFIYMSCFKESEDTFKNSFVKSTNSV